MSSVIEHYRNTMTQDDTRFFLQLGQKVATLRKEQRLTQVQLAEILRISQQHMASFEKGVRKIPSSMLPTLAQLFGVSLEELVGMPAPKNRRGPTPKLQQQLERISQLPRAKQRFVIEVLDTVLQQVANG